MVVGVVLALAGLLAGRHDGAAAEPVPTAPLHGPPHLTTLGDSITAGSSASDPNKSYPVLLAASLGATLTNLGIGGMTTGPFPGHTNAAGRIVVAPYPGVLAAEVPKIPLDSMIVTVFIGTNDGWLMSLDFHQPSEDNLAEVTAAWSTAFRTNLPAIVAGIRARVPTARIVVATVPNSANRTAVLISKDPWRQAVSDFSNAMKATIVASGVTVVDLQCEPGMYDDSSFAGPIDVHPNDAGHALIAAAFFRAIQHPTAVTPCKYGAPLSPEAPAISPGGAVHAERQ
jgi:lysophospholipase L1-like esterase